MRRSVLALVAAFVAAAVALGITSRPSAPLPDTTDTQQTDSPTTTSTATVISPTSAFVPTGSVGAISTRSAEPPSAPPPLPRAARPEPLTGWLHGSNRNFENELALYFGAPSDVLFLGDSITELLAYGAGRPLWQMVFEQIGALNFGVGSATTSHVLWQVEARQVALAEPKVVVLMIGTNNLANGDPPQDVALAVEKIVTRIGEQLPKTRILLFGILPRGPSGDPLRARIVQTNELLADLDGDRVSYMDIGHWFVFDGSIPEWLMPDGVHPSALGYLVYTILIWEKLMELYYKQ